jgi:hypothetical protein
VVLGLLAVKTPISKTIKRKKKISIVAYSINSEIAALAESLKRSNTREGV